MYKAIKIVSRSDILQYELRANKFAKHISNRYLQNVIGWWVARKVTKKYNRYLISLSELQEVSKTHSSD